MCAAYCADVPIRVSRVSQALKSVDGGAQLVRGDGAAVHGDVAHATVRVRERGTEHDAHAFFFASGAVVFWDVPAGLRKRVLGAVGGDAARRRMTDFDHEFAVVKGECAAFRDDAIVMHGRPLRELLSLSHGLAQSVELLTLEMVIDDLVMRTRKLPETLAATGESGMPPAALRRLMGEMMAARYKLSLVSDVLDVPEFFWGNPDLEPLYEECVAAVELRARAEILENRVIVIRDALDMLNGELRAASSHRVERAILALIAVEVAMEVAKLLPHATA